MTIRDDVVYFGLHEKEALRLHDSLGSHCLCPRVSHCMAHAESISVSLMTGCTKRRVFRSNTSGNNQLCLHGHVTILSMLNSVLCWLSLGNRCALFDTTSVLNGSWKENRFRLKRLELITWSKRSRPLRLRYFLIASTSKSTLLTTWQRVSWTGTYATYSTLMPAVPLYRRIDQPRRMALTSRKETSAWTRCRHRRILEISVMSA